MVADALARPAALGLSGASVPPSIASAQIRQSSRSINVIAGAVPCARRRVAAPGGGGESIVIAVGIALLADGASVSAVSFRPRSIRAPRKSLCREAFRHGDVIFFIHEDWRDR